MKLEENTRYPKTYNLWKRFENPPEMRGVMDRSKLSMPELGAVDSWHVTEKIDGTNIRIMLRPGNNKQHPWRVDFFTRKGTDKNITQSGAKKYLTDTFTLENIFRAVDVDKLEPKTMVVMYGELYGPGIQKGGGNYGSSIEYALFDVLIDDWWLEPRVVQSMAEKMEIRYPPVIWEDVTKEKIISFVGFSDVGSLLSPDHEMEGVVARASPTMLFRGSRSPIKFKLKFADMKRTMEWEEKK